MLSFLFSKKKLLGLDIGTSTIKLAELDVSKKQSSLVSFGILPTPAQSFASGDILDTQAVGIAVSDLMASAETKRNRLAVGLGGASVIVKRISIPRMDEDLVAEQIRWEAEQYVPYDINEVNLGFEVLKGTGSQENMDLLLVAAVTNHVFKYAEVAQLAGVSCDIVDVNGFALANCFRANYGVMQGQTVALLNIGATATNMVIVENGEVVFSRDIPVGGLTYTQDLQKALNVNLEEAEAIKLSLASGQAPEEAEAVIKSTHEVVMEEVRGSFDFFHNTSQTQGISRCFVSGGGSKIPGVVELISNLAPTEKMDPFFNIKVNDRKFSQDYLSQIRDFASIAVGLGIRMPGDA